MITIIDYGLGNIGAFLNMYKRMNIPARAADSADALVQAERIVLPGVGAFDHAMDRLGASGMRDALEHKVLEDGTPLLGVCVGMQILTDGSDEGARAGLGWIGGRTRALAGEARAAALPLPHMGWNDIAPCGERALFAGLDPDPRCYFLHSYYVEPDDPDHVAATSDYGLRFACAVQRGNIWGVQFHPEKSHRCGATILRNFAGL